jgi:beta-phosphoglucomutase-like phosphatase (HAD superfamily)
LPRPMSKPDPSVYKFACEQLRLAPWQTLAVEGSVNGVLSAVAAGCWTVGTVQFVHPDHRQARADALRHAGAAQVVASWRDVDDLLNHRTSIDGVQDRAQVGTREGQ